MSYIFMITTTRSNEHIPFFKKGAQIEAYITEHYISPGKKTILEGPLLSSDLLSETVVIKFASEESWKEYLKDPVVLEYLDEKNRYNYDHNISITKTVLDQV